MQLNITTDYAIRTVLYLGSDGKSRTAKEIAEEMCIPQNYLIKILSKLRKGGIITSFSGYAGGYQLKKYAYMLWGATVGYASIPKTLTNIINANINENLLDNYLSSIYRALENKNI